MLKYIVFHRYDFRHTHTQSQGHVLHFFSSTWISAYREYIQSVAAKKTISCPVSPLFTALESMVIAVCFIQCSHPLTETALISVGKLECDSFPSSRLSALRPSDRSVRTIDAATSHLPCSFREKLSEIFELLTQMHSWLEQMPNTQLYFDGIRHLLQVRDRSSYPWQAASLLDRFSTRNMSSINC